MQDIRGIMCMTNLNILNLKKGKHEQEDEIDFLDYLWCSI
jgi:hypothetical protein